MSPRSTDTEHRRSEPAGPLGDGLWNDVLLREKDPYATAKYEILLQWLGDLSGQSVLVVGSGSGEFAALLARSGGRVTAVDIDEHLVALTEATARRFGVEISTAVSSLEDLDPGAPYDLVVATDVIEHILNDEEAVAKLVKLVRRPGRVLITVPALQSLFGYHDEILGHHRRYNRRQLRHLVEPSVRIQRLRYFGFFLVPAALIVSRWLRRPYPLGPVGELKEKGGPLGSLLGAFFRLEKRLPLPLGTSLLLLGSPR